MFNAVGMGFGRRGGQPDLTQGQVSHYLLNNNADDSFGTYDGISLGTQNGSVDFQGDMGKFDGFDDFIKVATLLESDVSRQYMQATVSCFVKVDTINNGNADVIYNHFHLKSFDGYDGNGGFMLYIDTNGNVIFEYVLRDKEATTDSNGNYLNQYYVQAKSSFVLNTDTLYHIVGVLDNNNAKLYINGILDCEVSSVASIRYSTVVTDRPAITIGARYFEHVTTAYDFLDGSLSNIKIFNEVKDQAFIDALYAEGYYPKPLPLPTTTGLVSHYPLTGTSEDAYGSYNSTESSATYIDDIEFGAVYAGGGSIVLNTTATSLSVWCCYWVDTGSGWTFTSTTLIPSALSGSKYRNFRLYSVIPSTEEQTIIEEYEKNFRPIDIDDGLVAYYPLANNSLDNYHNQYDGTDTTMTYDGLSGVFNGSGYVTLGGGTTPYQDSTHTFSCWVKVIDLSAIRTIFSNSLGLYASGSSGNSGTILFINPDGTISLEYVLLNTETYTDDNGNEITSYGAFVRTLPSSITVNEWTHIAYTINNNRAELFINGEKVNGLTTTQNIQWSTSGVYVRLGCKSNASLSPSDFHNGNIAKNRFFGNVISPDRIKAIYNSEKGDFGL